MPYLIRNDVRLHYRVSGKGPFVALQHALTNDHRAFEVTGLRKSLADRGFACVTMDSVGHGASDAPSDAQRYSLSEQVGDFLAVLDCVGAERFAIFGYSMGAWLATGVIAKAKNRVRSAVLGGWDPIEGARKFTGHADDPAARTQEFAQTIQTLFAARRGVPAPAEQQINAYQHCYDELFQPLPTLDVLYNPETALGFFCGENDPYKPNMRRAAKVLDAPFETVPGDHVTAYVAPEASQLILRWLGENHFRSATEAARG